MFPLSFVEPRCVWPKHVRSTVRFARLMALVSARSRSSAGRLKYRPLSPSRNGSSAAGANGNGHSAPPRLRDRLCLLIRQHQLDANLVKAYAADSCGTPNLRDATREQIETFITNLSDWAVKDRPALLCKLNSYATPSEVSS